MIRLGKELEFISQIKRDGSGVKKVSKGIVKVMQNDNFPMTCLSITEGTYIATGFNSFVVKLKNE